MGHDAKPLGVLPVSYQKSHFSVKSHWQTRLREGIILPLWSCWCLCGAGKEPATVHQWGCTVGGDGWGGCTTAPRGGWTERLHIRLYELPAPPGTAFVMLGTVWLQMNVPDSKWSQTVSTMPGLPKHLLDSCLPGSSGGFSGELLSVRRRRDGVRVRGQLQVPLWVQVWPQLLEHVRWVVLAVGMQKQSFGSTAHVPSLRLLLAELSGGSRNLSQRLCISHVTLISGCCAEHSSDTA